MSAILSSRQAARTGSGLLRTARRSSRRTGFTALLAAPLLGAAAFGALPGGVAAAAAPAPTPHSQSFTYTGSTQYFTVPQGVTSLTLTLDGGSGGSGEGTALNTFPGLGGLGGRVVENLPVYGGQQLRIGVGAAGQDAQAPHAAAYGGYASGLASNGGTGGFGDGTDLSTGGSGGGGGAASEVDLLGNEAIGLPDRTVAVAGGGGGGAGTGSIIGYNGGFGGAGGNPAQSGYGGSGPGAGGGGTGGGSSRPYGDNAGSAPTASQGGGGGGGGGGYLPAGGGAGTGGGAGGAGEGGGGGGGGGQSFGESTATTYSQAPDRGDGEVTVAWSTPGVGQTITSSANPAVAGQTVVFTDVVTSSDPGGPAPTGTVALTRALGGTTFATATLVPTGLATSQATFSVTYPVPSLTGGLAYYFDYSGDAMYAANTSDQFIETIAHTVAGATVKPGKLAFGTHPVGSSTTRTITLTSAGTAALVVSSVRSTGAPFVLAGNTCAGKALTKGQTCRITVRFHPTNAAWSRGSLTVVDNAPNSPLRVPLTGTAR